MAKQERVLEAGSEISLEEKAQNFMGDLKDTGFFILENMNEKWTKIGEGLEEGSEEKKENDAELAIIRAELERRSDKDFEKKIDGMNESQLREELRNIHYSREK